MFGIVVLFEPERLAANGLVDLGQAASHRRDLAVVAVVDGAERLRELFAQEAEPVGAEETSAEEVEQRIEDQLFADAEHARVPGGVGGCEAALIDELAAVPVRALLVAAFHAAAADAAADAATERVEPPAAAAVPLDVVLRRREHRLAVVPERALLDLLEEFAADDRLVRRRRAPDPLLARTDERAAGALVVPAPDVEAGVLRVAQHRLQLRAAPGLRQVVLVLLVAGRRRVAVEVGVELVADRAEAEPADAVVLEDHPHDPRLDRVEDEPMLLTAVLRLLRVRVRVRLEQVPVGCGTAGVPALADAFFHAAAALLDQVAHVPLGDALLDAAGKDRGRVGGHRLVGREEADVALLEVALDPSRIRGHAREPVDALNDHRVEAAAVRGGREELGEAAVATESDAEVVAVCSLAAVGELLAAALDVPVEGDDLADTGLDGALAGGELPRQRQRGVLGVFGGDAAVEGESHLLLLRRVHDSGDPAQLDSLPQEPDDRRPLADAQLAGLGRIGDADDRLDAWSVKFAQAFCEVAVEIVVVAALVSVGHMPPVLLKSGLVRRVMAALGAPRRAGRHERSEESRPRGAA